ncbi:MAG: iron-sulfur protein [Pseudonocardiaceae bacterium]|nr:iron-sulfur protein [Pseudonocardiaceae bacterium]
MDASICVVDRAVDWMSWRVLDGDGAGDGWFRCDEVLGDPSFFTCWRATIARRLAERYHQVPERTPAGFALQWYLGVPAYTGAMVFHHARRVPELEPGRLAFRLEPAWLDTIALRPGRFWCLPDDPGRAHADAVVVADEIGLAAVLRRQVVAHAARFLRVYGPTVRFGPRTQWAAVTDALDTGLLMAGRSRGNDEAGVADARLVLADRHEPLTSASTTRTVVDDSGRAHWTRERRSCCFYYALPGVEQPCATCPRVDDTERARILRELSAT